MKLEEQYKTSFIMYFNLFPYQSIDQIIVKVLYIYLLYNNRIFDHLSNFCIIIAPNISIKDYKNKNFFLFIYNYIRLGIFLKSYLIFLIIIIALMLFLVLFHYYYIKLLFFQTSLIFAVLLKIKFNFYYLLYRKTEQNIS